MSSTSLSVGRRILGSEASILFIVFLVISRSAKSKAGAIIRFLALLSLAPVIITPLLVEINVHRSASVDLGVELPHSVVELRRTRARTAAARSLLRACRSLPTPSMQARQAIASRYVAVFDTTLSRLYLFKHAFGHLVDVRLSISPETHTSIVTVLNGLRERDGVVTTLPRLSRPLGPGLVPGQLLAPVERLAINQTEDLVGLPSLSSTGGNYRQPRTLSTATLATSQAPSLADTISVSSPLDPITPTPLSDVVLSTAFTSSEQTTSEFTCDSTSDHVDDKTKDLKAALILNETRLSGATLAALVNLLEKSRIPFRSLPGPPEDDEPRTTNANSLVARPSRMSVVLSPLDTNRSTALRCTLPSIILTPSHQKTSEIIFDATLDYAGKSISDPAPASNLHDTRYSGVSVATSSMSGGMTQNNLFGISSIPFPSLPGLPNDDGLPTTNADSLVSKPGGMNALGLFLSAPSSKTVPSASSLGRAKDDIDASSLSFKRSRKVAFNGGSMNPVGWRGNPLDEATMAIARGRGTIALPRLIDSALSTPSLSSNGGTPASTLTSSPAPSQSTAPTSIDPPQDHQWETGTSISIPCSKFQSLDDAQAQGAEASVQEALDDGRVEETFAWWRNGLQSKDVRSTRHTRYGPRNNALESMTDEEWKWAKTEGEKPVDGRKPLLVKKPAPPITFVASDTVDAEEGSTDGEDDLDEDGFSKSQQQKVKEASKKAMVMLSYGASTSRALQPLSEEEWASLEQFSATSSSLPDVSPPPTPLSIGIEKEVAQGWLPPPPPTFDTAPMKIKRSSRTKKVLKRIVKRVKTTFHLKSRSRDAGVA